MFGSFAHLSMYPNFVYSTSTLHLWFNCRSHSSLQWHPNHKTWLCKDEPQSFCRPPPNLLSFDDVYVRSEDYCCTKVRCVCGRENGKSQSGGDDASTTRFLFYACPLAMPLPRG